MLAEPISEKLDLAFFLGSTEKNCPKFGTRTQDCWARDRKGRLKTCNIYSQSLLEKVLMDCELDLIDMLKRLSYQTRQIN